MGTVEKDECPGRGMDSYHLGIIARVPQRLPNRYHYTLIASSSKVPVMMRTYGVEIVSDRSTEWS